ncbi:hypothetical protein PG991_003076 [Apiospora marii]|uniref:Amidase domain-containing protein n=1 Tax=Apiospora marii TaxID=335849 RepID=A0ABR1SJI5_9PEZI
MDKTHATAKGKMGRNLHGPPPSSALTIINIDGKKYLLQLDAQVLSVGPLTVRNGRQYIPATSFGDLVKDAKDPKEVARMFKEDDVWSEEFLSLIIYTPEDAGRIDAFLAAIPAETTASRRTLNVANGQATPLAPGPYVFDCLSGNLYRPYRLFEDTSNAFVRGALPIGGMAIGMGYSSNMYQCLEVSDMISIPSKLYHLGEDRSATKKPLAGLRFGVKDSIDIAGLHTSNGSKDYRETYPPRTETAPCVARLIEAGAVMVGKLRCGQWCDGQDPVDSRLRSTREAMGSRSPRAPAPAQHLAAPATPGSTSPSAPTQAAPSATPAAVNGVYGVRPSTGRIQGDMMLVCSPLLDTPGVLARSAAVAEKVTKVMLSSDPSPPQAHHQSRRRRFKLLYAVEPNLFNTTPKFFSAGGTGPEAPTAAGQVMEAFVSRLEAYLNCQRKELNLYDLWDLSTRYTDDLVTATEGIYENLVYGHLARTAVARFVADYRARRDHDSNAQPFIEATTRKRLEYGQQVSDSEMRDSERCLKAVGDWINGVVLPGPRRSTSTTTTTAGNIVTFGEPLDKQKMGEEKEEEEEDAIPLLLYPQSWAQPSYRDDPSTRARLGPDGEPLLFWTGFSAYSLAYSSGCPDIAVPLGEVPFASRITGEDSDSGSDCTSSSTKLPVAISIMAPRGMDEVLLGLLRELEEVGVLREVQCGSRMFGD